MKIVKHDMKNQQQAMINNAKLKPDKTMFKCNI